MAVMTLRCKTHSAILPGPNREEREQPISISDWFHLINLLDRCKIINHTCGMRVKLPHRPRGPAAFLLIVLLAVSSCTRDKSWAEAPKVTASRTTLIIFAEHQMRDSQWAGLFDALHYAAASESAQVPALGPDPELVRGDRIAPGLEIEKPITVYLHGDCSLVPMPQYATVGALGWVYRSHGRIAPFVHVDCTEIVQELGSVVFGMDRKRRDALMGEAIARVIVHEWVHVTTQSAGHERAGVRKSSFGILDLLAADDAIWRDPRFALKKRPEL
jgi:hypothetical protein